jgi:hypothetical protein
MGHLFNRAALALCCAGWLVATGPVLAEEAKPEPKPLKLTTTADHAKFKELQKTFNSGPEVTKACLACHTEAAGQIHRTKHWKWEYLNPDTKQTLGKKTVVNNFCISVASNEAACNSCHIGYGWKDASFDFKSEENVDCLACHDTTGNYKKPSGLAGNVVTKDMEFPPGSGKILKAIDLSKIAQKVGKSSRDTCGACHFFGGGGDGVKHGDLDSSMSAPEKELDVHMDATGLDFTCGTCHKTSSHDVAGSRYAPTAKDSKGAHLRGKTDNGNPATCVACHNNAPHKIGRAAEPARGQDRLPDLPHPQLRPRRHSHQDDLGLVDGRPARCGRQADHEEGRQGSHHLRIAQGRLHPGRERQARIRLVQRQRDLHADHRQDREERPARADQQDRRQPERRQVDDLADEGVPRLAAL